MTESGQHEQVWPFSTRCEGVTIPARRTNCTNSKHPAKMIKIGMKAMPTAATIALHTPSKKQVSVTQHKGKTRPAYTGLLVLLTMPPVTKHRSGQSPCSHSHVRKRAPIPATTQTRIFHIDPRVLGGAIITRHFLHDRFVWEIFMKALHLGMLMTSSLALSIVMSLQQKPDQKYFIFILSWKMDPLKAWVLLALDRAPCCQPLWQHSSLLARPKTGARTSFRRWNGDSHCDHFYSCFHWLVIQSTAAYTGYPSCRLAVQFALLRMRYIGLVLFDCLFMVVVLCMCLKTKGGIYNLEMMAAAYS